MQRRTESPTTIPNRLHRYPIISIVLKLLRCVGPERDVQRRRTIQGARPYSGLNPGFHFASASAVAGAAVRAYDRRGGSGRATRSPMPCCKDFRPAMRRSAFAVYDAPEFVNQCLTGSTRST